MSAPTLEDRRVKRIITCVHEAGHCTVDFKLGLAFVKVRIISDVSGVVEGRREVQRTDTWRQEAIASASGLAAELIFLRMKGWTHLIDDAMAASWQDLDNVVFFARKAGAKVSDVRSVSHGLIKVNWAPTWRTAQALMQRPTLTEKQARQRAGI